MYSAYGHNALLYKLAITIRRQNSNDVQTLTTHLLYK